MSADTQIAGTAMDKIEYDFDVVRQFVIASCAPSAPMEQTKLIA